MTKIQTAFPILIFFFILFIGDSLAESQMVNEFKGCTVTINVCETKCKSRFGARAECVTAGPVAAPPHPALLQPAKLNAAARKCRCNCKCTYKKKK
ncbi:hypothetical protein ABFS83_12G006700 [Erythranthe nasuta]